MDIKRLFELPERASERMQILSNEQTARPKLIKDTTCKAIAPYLRREKFNKRRDAYTPVTKFSGNSVKHRDF